jgi:uracil-DNA glycosylase
MNGDIDFHAAKAMLLWQMELGADEAIGEVPVNRYAAAEAAKAVAPAPVVAAPVAPAAVAREPVTPGADPVLVARHMAEGARDLPALRDALAAYDHCDLKKGARSLVFADGNPLARVMIVGEAPGRDEDLQGLPFVGRAGQLLDRMFDAIGMGRGNPDAERALYITNVLPWRPPENRDPSPEEAAMMLPFLKRHVELVDPEVMVLMGNHSCQALLGRKGITRLRGQWTEALGRPVLPMFHPAYLLRNPAAKREAWHDLLMLQARLRGGA